MEFKPHDYQSFCIEYIREHPVAALLLDMGLGKTVITLTALRAMMLDDLQVSKTLVIAPLRVARDTWPAEVRKWDHLKDLDVSVIVGDLKTRTAAVNENTLVYVVNRENIKWLVEYYEKNGRRWDFDCVVIDELSSFKNYQSQRFKYLRKVRPYVRRWVGLTGTPTSNGLMDLWAEIGILDGGERLGRFIGRYREAYFKPGSMNPSTGIVFQYIPRPGAEEQIYSRISDITISMKAIDYLKMPDCVSVEHTVSMDGVERKLYDQLKSDLIIPLEDGDIDAANAASLSGKLLQMANGAVYDENGETRIIHSRKLEVLEDLVEASKAQTGNLEVNLAPCDAGVFLTQADGEYEEKLRAAALSLVVKQPDHPVMILADGRRMWRIFDNLMNNVCKYAQPDTRVYLSLEERTEERPGAIGGDGASVAGSPNANGGAAGSRKAVIVLKNTSRDPLDITEEELMERFVRGDSARSSEGNGLGLSIAKSLAELQGGSLRLEIDGDLFKAVLGFPVLV